MKIEARIEQHGAQGPDPWDDDRGICLPLGVWLGLAPGWMPWHPVQAMGAQGFWIALVVGLTIAAVGLVWLLERLSLQWLRAAPAAV